MIRYIPFVAVLVATVAFALNGYLLIAAFFGLLVLVGIWDIWQIDHSLLRNYPIVGHFRGLAEEIRPQVHQYFVEGDTQGRPFDREQRSLVYQRAKNAVDSVPFGTERDVTEPGYEWFTHSVAPVNNETRSERVTIGNEACAQPYESSFLNISAMSFGSLSAAAIRALNRGAQAGGFAHDTGEGGLSPYHEEFGGDIIWEIGTGYFGTRTANGAFDLEKFTEKAALPQIKMLEIKLSQGAKPGHGGILPAAKVSREIAFTRGVPEGKDCISPPFHSTFHTPIGLLEFVQQLREHGSGKPVGFKLCIGRKSEFLGICKAMIETQIYPDFIVVDGKEGGTGAAPAEFINRVGMPLRDSIAFVNNALVGSGLRSKIKLGASGKVVSGFDMAMCLGLGADWCNSARGFMLALGCLQSQKCHTNTCPVGIATQDPKRQRGLVVEEKYQRVANFHHHTVDALWDLTGAAGLATPSQITASDFFRRSASGEAAALHIEELLEPDALVSGSVPEDWVDIWQQANAQTFR